MCSVVKPDRVSEISKMLYSCLFCEHKTDSLVDFEGHKRTVHGFQKGSFQCSKCSYVSRNIRCLKDHYDSVHDGIKYPCDECEKLYANTRALKVHKRAIHRQVPYFCKLCDFKCFRGEGLKDHVSSQHEGIRHYCDQCAYSAKSKKGLSNHIVSHHTGLTRPQRKSFFKKVLIKKYCDQCGFVTSNVTQLKEHIAVRHEGKVYNCDQCTFVTQNQSSLKVHKESKHEHIKHKCDQCDMSFSLYSSLAKHKKLSIQNGKKYSCDICGFTSCLGKVSINLHKRRDHSTADQLLPCDQCDKAFFAKTNLIRHKRMKHALKLEQSNESDQEG